MSSDHKYEPRSGRQNLPPRREILDARGRLWRVYLRADALDRRSSPSLVFDCAEIIRLVRDFPADWDGMPDDELMLIAERI
jgi:hypothetical protein